MFGKKGGLFGNIAAKANDAAETATGQDLDGDGDIGGVPAAQFKAQQAAKQQAAQPAAQPAAPAAQPSAAARTGAAPAPAAAPAGGAPNNQALLNSLSGALQNSGLQAKIGSVLSSSGKVKPGAGGFLGLNSLFASMPAAVQSSAEQQNRALDDGANMELSTCTGRKRALLIGINYTGTPAQLKGCINDVKNIKAFVVSKFNFPTDPNSMRVLVDDGTGDDYPTRANIVAGIKWLVDGAAKGDSLFIHYSGHGATSKDTAPDTDEADGQDETLVPLDYQTAGMIVDDDLFDMLVQPLPRGVRLTAIMDCCHSGSVFDLPYSYVLEAGRDLPTEIDNRKIAIAAAMAAGKALFAGDKAGALKNFMEAAKHGALAYASMQQQPGAAGAGAAAAPQQQAAAQQPQAAAAPAFLQPQPAAAAPAPQAAAAAPASSATNPSASNLSTSTNVNESAIHIRTALADVIQFSGCKDEQTSADAFIGGESTGAMSYAFVKAFNDFGLDQTYSQLLRNVRTTLQGKYKQIPQMSVGHKMVNMEAKFIM